MTANHCNTPQRRIEPKLRLTKEELGNSHPKKSQSEIKLQPSRHKKLGFAVTTRHWQNTVEKCWGTGTEGKLPIHKTLAGALSTGGEILRHQHSLKQGDRTAGQGRCDAVVGQHSLNRKCPPTATGTTCPGKKPNHADTGTNL